MLNTIKLSKVIKEKGLTVYALAERVGVNKSTFFRKLKKGGEKFMLWEIESITKHLELSKPEMLELFFM